MTTPTIAARVRVLSWTIPAPGEFVVYRLYDAGGALLYVGMSYDVTKRLAEHARFKKWWPTVTRIENECYPSREAAAAREREVIETLFPRHNAQYRPGIGFRTDLHGEG